MHAKILSYHLPGVVFLKTTMRTNQSSQMVLLFTYEGNFPVAMLPRATLIRRCNSSQLLVVELPGSYGKLCFFNGCKRISELYIVNKNAFKTVLVLCIWLLPWRCPEVMNQEAIAAAMRQWRRACLAVIKLMARNYSNAMLQGAITDTSGQERPSVSHFLVSSLLSMADRKSRMRLHLDWSCAEKVRWVILVHMDRTFLRADLLKKNCSNGEGLLDWKVEGKPLNDTTQKILMNSPHFGKGHQRRFTELTSSIPLHDLHVWCDFGFSGGPFILFL